MKYVVISGHHTALITLAAFEISDSIQVVSASCRRSVARLQSMNWALQGNSVFTCSSSTGRSRCRITDRTPTLLEPAKHSAHKHFSGADVCNKGPRTNVFHSFTSKENTMLELIKWLETVPTEREVVCVAGLVGFQMVTSCLCLVSDRLPLWHRWHDNGVGCFCIPVSFPWRLFDLSLITFKHHKASDCFPPIYLSYSNPSSIKLPSVSRPHVCPRLASFPLYVFFFMPLVHAIQRNQDLTLLSTSSPFVASFFFFFFKYFCESTVEGGDKWADVHQKENERHPTTPEPPAPTAMLKMNNYNISP